MRRVLSRLFLVAFLGVAVFAVVRLSSGPPGALVAFETLKPDRLYHQAFRVTTAGRFAVDAAGSYEEVGSAASDTTLAAYAWLVRRSSGELVWMMRPPRPSRGTLVSVEDTLQLDEGVYDAYFTGYGDPLVREPGPRDGSLKERVRAFLSRGGRSWVGDAGRWRYIVSKVSPARGTTDDVEDDPEDDDDRRHPLTVWEGLAVDDDDREEAILNVTAQARATIQTVTEMTDGVVADRGTIIRLGSRDTVWTVSGAGEWAGGSLKNRRFTETIDLEPGLYRISFETDRSHAYRDWTANPPYEPWSWGIRLRKDTAVAAIALFDPADIDLPLIAEFECVGPDEQRDALFTVTDSTDVLLVAVGEVTAGEHYDWAKVDRQDGTTWDRVWEMPNHQDDLDYVGGASKNRRAVETLALVPGTYRMRYVSDGSHDCDDDFRGDGPDDGFWGARLFSLDPDLDVSTLSVEVTQAAPSTPELPLSLELPDSSRLIARIDSVEDGEVREVEFTLDESQQVLAVALTELSESSQFDYATLSDRFGRQVWQTTWENTVPGGDQLYFRRFEATLDLDPGRYTLRYETDGSRSFGDFGPDSEILWGVHLYSADGDEE